MLNTQTWEIHHRTFLATRFLLLLYVLLMLFGHLNLIDIIDVLICFLSSGTSSSTMKPKLIPYFDSSLSKAASFIGHRGSVAVRQRWTNQINFHFSQNLKDILCLFNKMSFKFKLLQAISSKARSEQDPMVSLCWEHYYH